jgi:aspartate/tyrosine/aromatic aminotransferase
LACIDGYSIAGGACTSNNILTVQIVLAPSCINQSTIFSSLDTDYIQLAKTIKNVNRLVNSFCQILQSSLLVNSSCSQSFSIRSIKLGSIIMNIPVDANRVKDVNAAENRFTRVSLQMEWTAAL